MPKITYAFTPDQPLTLPGLAEADPQAIGESLDRIATENGGRLKPAVIVEKARPRRHPLHRFFEWDDERAAEKYRQDQARTLVRSVQIVDAERERPSPAFISISDRKDGRSYRRLGEVLSSRELSLEALRQAARDLRAFEERYDDLKDVVEIIRLARERIATRIEEEARP